MTVLATAPPVQATAPPAAAPTPAAPAAAEVEPELGPLGRLLAHFGPHAQAGIQDADAVVGKIRDEYRAHAKEVFYLAHLALAAAEEIDPAGTPVIAELEAKALQLAKVTAERAAEVLAPA